LGFLRAAERSEASGKADVVLLAKRLVNDVFGLLNRANVALLDSLLTPEGLARTVCLEAEGWLDAKGTKKTLEQLFTGGGLPDEAAKNHLAAPGGADDASAEQEAVLEILSLHPDWVAEYKNGKKAVKNALLGEVMKKLARKGNPRQIHRLLDEALA